LGSKRQVFRTILIPVIFTLFLLLGFMETIIDGLGNIIYPFNADGIQAPGNQKKACKNLRPGVQSPVNGFI
jgi:hypothetical protein